MTADGAGSRPMQNQFPLCRLQLLRSGSAGNSGSDSGSDERFSAQGDAAFSYVMVVQQDLDDGKASWPV